MISATASAQDLPPEVARAYQDYQIAYAAGDAPALLEAADRAYTAGDVANIDSATLATLAENFGFAAGANGELETAQEMWRQSARMSDRARLDPVDRAWRWHNAALSALRLQDVDDAFACSSQAVEALDDLDGQSAASGFAADSYLTHAGMALRRGHLRATGTSASEAVALMEAAGPQLELRYGLALFYQGVSQTLDGDFFDAALSLSIGSRIIAQLAPDHPDLGALRAARASALVEISRGDEAEAEARLALLQTELERNVVYAEHFLGVNAEETDGVDRPEGWVDAAPINRVEPEYPLNIAAAGLGGVIYVRFDLTPDAEVENIEILGGFPYQAFDEAAVHAVERWTYSPATLNGVPVRREGIEVRFQFQLAEPGTSLRQLRRQEEAARRRAAEQ